MISITGKDAFKYATLPRIRTRIETLFMSGFQFIAYFMASVYSAVNLLPSNHPYTDIRNVGKFGIRHVIAEAANNLVFKKENIDQIILFIAILIGLVLIFAQIALLAFALFTQPVLAIPTNFRDFFLTPAATETTDIAHIMMDLVFGIGDGTDNLFNSCISQGITCQQSPQSNGGALTVVMAQGGTSIFAPYGFPFPIHQAMHQMFQLYNTGLLVVAAFIATYFIITVVAETAQTGTAFGKRFNKVWAPIRIVFAFGMLVPVGFGLNGSQWSVLYAAKFGSGFATNGWNLFNTTIAGGYFGDLKELVSAPNIPEVAALLQFFYVARTCAHLQELSMPEDDQQNAVADPSLLPTLIRPYLVKSIATPPGEPFQEVEDTTGYEEIIDFYGRPNNGGNASTVKIRFGIQNSSAYSQYTGTVKPFCGEVIFKLQDARHPAESGLLAPEPGVLVMQQTYWTLLKNLWFTEFVSPQDFPLNTVRRTTQWEHDSTAALPPEVDDNFRQDKKDAYVSRIRDALLGSGGAIELMAVSDRFNVGDIITEKGWAGAAIWYNRIAEMNGIITSAALNIPYPSKYPDIMEYILNRKKQVEEKVSFEMRFNPILNNGDVVQFAGPRERQMSQALWTAFDFWQTGGVSTTHTTPTGNAMIDSINAIFGTEGLYNIRKNPNSHPLAQIVGVGRSLIESSIRNLTLSVTGGAVASLFSIFDDAPTQLISIPATFLVTVTMVALTAGFVMFYVVPFLPFIYFFFAVGGWIKGIFEAMVGAPLWALAHIRIDQNGLPGQAGVAGYFLIFEIFIRPILIIFGMLASISIFSALVNVLHQIFDLVISNVGGFDNRLEAKAGKFKGLEAGSITNLVSSPTVATARNAIDEFFFTIIYTIIIYLMAMSSFKLIDLIPNNILRWMGQSIATFNDQREDAAQGLVGKATIGAQQTSGALGGGLKEFVG